MPLFEWFVFEYSINPAACLQIVTSEPCCSIALQHKNGYLRQFLIGAFAENTHSPLFINRGNFSCLLNVFSIESGSPYKTRLNGAQEKEGAHHGRRIDWISGCDSGDGSPPRGAVYLLPGAQAAQRRAARGHCPRSRHSDGAGIEPGGAFPPRGNPAG